MVFTGQSVWEGVSLTDRPRKQSVTGLPAGKEVKRYRTQIRSSQG